MASEGDRRARPEVADRSSKVLGLGAGGPRGVAIALVSTLGAIEVLNQAQIDVNATFNFTPYLAAALLFVAITIPLARFTDWLLLRDRRRRQSAGVA